jgi:hypothetical protein
VNDITPFEEQTLQEKARIRAAIRRSATTRRSVKEGRPDSIAELLEEMADVIDLLEAVIEQQ